MVLHDHSVTAAGTLLSGCVVCVCVLTLFQICASQHATSSAAVAACLVCRIGATLSCSVLASSSFLHFAKMKYFTGTHFLHPISKTWQYKSQIRSLKDPVQKIRPGP